MKTLKSLLMVLLSMTLLTGVSTSASAQKDASWREKIMSEKIAFFSAEMNLTPKEAQDFWPIYNAYCKEEDEAQRKIMRTFKELSEAINSEKSPKEISVLLDRYLNAREAKRNLSTNAAERFKKVLPAEKVAKLYIAEEKFRRNQIHRLHHNQGAKK